MWRAVACPEPERPTKGYTYRPTRSLVHGYAVFVRRLGSPTPRNFSEWFVIEDAKIRTR
jgi:hypothetical protein